MNLVQVQKQYGQHESLGPLHQVRNKVVLVALIVDPMGRCLMIDGGLRQEDHRCLGTQKCILPFTERVLRSGLGLSKVRVHSMSRVYDEMSEGPSSRAFVITRTDVKEAVSVSGGEWVTSAERAVSLARGDLIPLRCIQQFMGDSLAWQLPPQQMS